MTEITESMEHLEKVSVPSWVSAKGGNNINSTDPVNRVLRQIQKRLDKYSEWFGECWQHIYINTVSVDDHKPILVSIGPNHWDTIKPDVMEVHKLKYLKDYVERINTNVEDLVWANLQAFRQIEWELQGRRRDHDDVFVEMCILDGCFVIELFLKSYNFKVVPDDDDGGVIVSRVNDRLFKSKGALDALRRDLIQPNNQLPFEVLNILCKRVRPHRKSRIEDHHDDFKFIIDLALDFLCSIVPNQTLKRTSFHHEHEKRDLLGIVYDGLDWRNMSSANYCNHRIHADCTWNMAKSATELKEFGVEFKKSEAFNFPRITFTNDGVLMISCMRIRYGTPYSIKILLAYEKSHRQHNYLNDYLWFINSLVKSPSDIQLLRQREIIDNLSELADDVAIHKFLKDLYASLIISPDNFNYIQVCRDLDSHCKHRQNRWMAKLKRDYFNSPWAFISFFAAFLLLVLTIVQTVFSVASYYKRG